MAFRRFLSACLALTSVASTWAVDIKVTSTKNVTIPSTLYGFMFEDISHSGDGGIYAELLQNRAFQAVTPGTEDALAAWNATGGATLTVVNNTAGVSEALPNSLEVHIPTGTKSAAGALNTGFWGINVQSDWKYSGTFYAKSNTFRGKITAALTSADGRTVYDSATIAGIGSSYKKFEYTLQPKHNAPDANNVLSITVDGHQAAGQTIHFGLFTLFPPTFKNRPNGMRIDLAEKFQASKPSIWRFPGGNNLEGVEDWNTRWKWNATIGPLEDRPGRFANWGYPNTDGLGLLEYMQWMEDLEMEPILAIWSGISVGNYSDLPSWPVVPQDELQPYIDEAANEIEFLTADAKTNKWGALRASLGREQPYQLKYIEVGNEDQFQEPSYQAYRWNMFVTQLGAKFPDLEFLATCYPSLALDPPYTYIDFHMYAAPDWFTDNAFMFDWDNYPRNGTHWFIGEFAVTSTNDSDTLGTPADGRLVYPTLQGASAEAAFLTGLERNSDIVFASAYAPTLNHISSTDWTPNMMTFDPIGVAPSVSYYMQQMFSINRGTHTLLTEPVSSPEMAPLFWVASVDERTDTVFVKVSNAGNSSVSTTMSLGFSLKNPTAVATVLSGPATASNTLDNPSLIVPKDQNFSVKNGAFSWTFPSYSVTVLKFQASM